MSEKPFTQFNYFIEDNMYYVANNKYGIVLLSETEAGMVMNLGNEIIKDMNNLANENNELKNTIKELEHRIRELECHLKYKEQTIDALINNEFVLLKESFEERLRNNPMPTNTLEHDV